jgi:hypothetical protein
MTVTVPGRALVADDAGGVAGERQERPDPEVPEKARRRTFTAQYKLDVVAEYDAAATGEKGAVLRTPRAAPRRATRQRTLPARNRAPREQPRLRRVTQVRAPRGRDGEHEPPVRLPAAASRHHYPAGSPPAPRADGHPHHLDHRDA